METIVASGNYYLAKDITLTDTWLVPEGQKITLCLNGHWIKQTTDDKSVITVSGLGTWLIIDDCNGKMHYFTRDATGLWTLITNGDTSEYSVTGGVITGGESEYGYYGGGVNVMNKAIFEMCGGNIAGNTATGNGGGVLAEGTSSSITYFLMSGGKIIGNTANNGAGVWNYGGRVEIYGDAEVAGNTATGNGGGVLNTKGLLGSASGFFAMSDDAKIDKVYLTAGTLIHINGNEFNGGVTNLDGINIEDGRVVVEIDESSTLYADDIIDKFTLADSSKILVASDDNKKLEIKEWDTWTTPNALPSDPGYYILGDDITLSGEWEVPSGDTYLDLNGHSIIQTTPGSRVITYPSGEQRSLTVSDSNSEVEHTFHKNVNGVWTLDNPAEKSGDYLLVKGGVITGGNVDGSGGANSGGAVYLEDNGEFIMTGGNIVGNTATYNGGGVSNKGTFTMSGGNIIGNTAYNGGGVYNYGGSIITLTDGNIMGNTATENGGGVYNQGILTLTVSGNTIIEDNVAGESDVANNVYLSNGNKITLGESGLGAGANIGVTTQTDPRYGNPVTVIDTGMDEDKMGKFFADKDATERLVVEDGAMKLRLKPTPAITAATLELDTSIAIIFKVHTESMEGYTDPHITATFKGEEFELEPVGVKDSNHIFKFKQLSPANMTEEISATLYATKEGNKETFGSVTYSIKQYCMNTLGNSPTPELRTLCVDLLNYGSSAQLYVDPSCDPNTFANATLTETQKGWATPGTPEAGYLKEKIGEETPGVGSWKYGSLNLYTNISVMFYFTPGTDLDKLEAIVAYGKDGGESMTIDTLEFNYVRVELNPVEMNYPIKVTLKNKETNEVSQTIKYGVDPYYKFATESPGKPLLANLATDTMKYIKSAKAYADAA